MKLDRYMVELFFEIRRNLPTIEQRQMKISAPDLGPVMVELYKTTDNEQTRFLIEVFLKRAGEGWFEKTVVKASYYRGSKITHKKPNPVTPDSNKKKNKSVRYYRGVLIED